MTATMNPMNTPPPPVAQIGELVPLGSVVLQVDVAAETTMPDTPNGYSAAVQVMADQGDLDTEALAGPMGPPGQISFAVRREVNPYINTPADLRPLTNTPDDIGRYFLLQEHDAQGTVISQTAYIWYGTKYRALMMGSWGPPGPVPDITPEVELIDPLDDYGNPVPSIVATSGPRLDPIWLFQLASPPGPVGQITPFRDFPDVDAAVAPVDGDLMSFTGTYTVDGTQIWVPKGLGAILPRTYSMPESEFVDYQGVAQSAPIGSFAIEPQPFPWTPIVWGHLGRKTSGITLPPIAADIVDDIQLLIAQILALFAGGDPITDIIDDVTLLIDQIIALITGSNPAAPSQPISGDTSTSTLTGNPLMIGCRVLLGDPTTGTQVARGLGNTLGRVIIQPHYSSSTVNNGQNQSITPGNHYAIVPANHTGAEGTLYVNLWNDGQLGAYSFNSDSAQLFVSVLPMGPIPGGMTDPSQRRRR